MVNSRLAKLLLALVFLTLQTTTQARTVRKVTIDETGLNLDTQDSNLTEGCKKFKPTINQVRHYFEKAYPVESHTITTERYSPCYTTGTITFSDNSSGKFQLYSGGTSTLFWSRGGAVNLLYKKNKWRDPFACNYGLGDEQEC
ncbi:hypothetical protein [Burkholderia ubonensis]|uniref:hypothetical protein n=1 Tax=Burkholderia ubonensis TaxID=101571 RepID=UPI0012FB9BBF|nr:hypothetical protein [Burkholderia ubonensis]